MKRLMFAFSLFMICAGAYASQDFVVDTSDADMLMDKRTEIQNNLSADYEKLLAQVNELDPSYARYLGTQNNLSTEQKLQKLRSWSAQKAFEYYEKLFHDEMNAKSQQTGRKIHSELWGNNQTYEWLDRGELDTKKCMLDGDERRGWSICKYPDGFEDYYLTREYFDSQDNSNKYSQRTSNGYDLLYHKDMSDKNSTQTCMINIQYDTFNSNDSSVQEDDVQLIVNCTIYRYDDYYVWKNQEVEDTIAGKYDVVEVKDYGGPFEKIYITRAHEQDWKSNYLPTYRVMGYDISASRTSETKESKL